jgi:alpha-1,3-rhamnosyl/mannosyltransferase
MTAVIINMLWLRPGQVGGSETYATQLLKALSKTPGSPPIELVMTPAAHRVHQLRDTNFAITEQDPPLGRIGRIWLENRLFKRVDDHQLVHHLGGTIPKYRNNQKTVVTIYDVQYRDYPQYFSLAKRRYLDGAIQRSLEQAEAVCTISEYCARSLEAHFGYPQEKCRIVPPAFDAPAPRPHHSPEGKKFLLYPAVTWPHKSHEFLIKLLEQLPDLQLVLTGAPGPSHRSVMKAIRRSPAADRITHLGMVDTQRLNLLYQEALCTVFPSQYEGFGQPVIEAMTHGCPVISSQCGALPETVGTGGVTLPMNIDRWVDAIQLIRQSRQRQQWVEAGLLRAADFSSTRTAETQVAIYNELLGR